MRLAPNLHGFKTIVLDDDYTTKNSEFKKWINENFDYINTLFGIYSKYLPDTLSFNMFINYLYSTKSPYYI